MDKGKKINWKNDLLLSAVSYLLPVGGINLVHT